MRILCSLAALLLCLPELALAASEGGVNFHLTDHWVGFTALAIFVIAYTLVVFEEQLHLRKSKPVMIGAGLIWALVAMQASVSPEIGPDAANSAFKHVFLEFAELFFFLIVAMSYVTAMTERNVFESLRAKLVSRGFSYRKLFWITGVIAFFLSPIVDNLTTALIMSSVILAVGQGNARFITLSFINIVVAANSGGAFSAFGDITTLMAWQAQKAEFFEFFYLFVPSAVNFLVPAAIMHFGIPTGNPAPGKDDASIKFGGIAICVLFAVTIAITVSGKQFLHMPPVFGMMLGLGLLKIFGYVINRVEARRGGDTMPEGMGPDGHDHGTRGYNIFRVIANAEWDTLLFFYGVLMCVGGLAAMGYLSLASTEMYGTLGPTWTNILLGGASAIVDNIPVMYAVLQMNPSMDLGQWLLITLTTGVGGSMLSVGSAAGVALMGQSRGMYTFFGHLKWTWAIALGYAASIAVHLLINGHLFTGGI